MFKFTEFIEKVELPSFSAPSCISCDRLSRPRCSNLQILSLRHKLNFSLQITSRLLASLQWLFISGHFDLWLFFLTFRIPSWQWLHEKRVWEIAHWLLVTHITSAPISLLKANYVAMSHSRGQEVWSSQSRGREEKRTPPWALIMSSVPVDTEQKGLVNATGPDFRWLLTLLISVSNFFRK